MRRSRRVPAAFFLALLLFLVAGDALRLSPVELASAPYRYALLEWEISHLPDKWAHKLRSVLPLGSGSRQERLEDLQHYFRLSQEIRSLEREQGDIYIRAGHIQGGEESDRAAVLSEELAELRRTRSALRADVEETLETEVGSVLSAAGLKSPVGLLLPPVDVALTRPPRVLVVSPRATIERSESVLLEADIGIDAMNALEEKVLGEQDMAALVVNIGGVATYPTIVTDNTSLLFALRTAAHEWLHAYWFFRPLGWNIFSSPEMNTLNETAASLAGDELGDRVFQAVTGHPIEDPRPPAPPPRAPPEEEPDRFDFNAEMRETRLEVDRLLGEGRIEGAEGYMDRRRRVFVDNGYNIRKLNQAYFAFHGSYAASPASVSPIGGQVERVREASASLGDFIRTMSGFGNIQEFRDYVASLDGAAEDAPEPAARTVPAR
ncbi:MAG: hypothetical protein J4F43_03580 [Dehalococcoidia bacterium]|nr:hypothetical protein [Dehalococcoidia bacterium]